MRNPADILNLYRERRVFYDPLHAKMLEIAAIYNGQADVPLPDMERNEQPSVPNLLAQGVDQMAGRITSVTPNVTFASARPGTRMYDRRAQDAQRTTTGWWQADRLMMKQKQRGRRLIAYAMAPVVVRWNYKEHRPTWHVRHPMETFPSLDLEPGKVSPNDCIFTFKRSVGWMRANGYADRVASLFPNNGQIVTADAQITMIEYIDADHTVLMAATHSKYDMDGFTNYAGAMKGVVLENVENQTGGRIPVVIPVRLTLDTLTGQFDNMIGMYYAQAKLMALESIAVEKGIFPDTYLVSRPGEMGRFIDGPHDGRTGKVNVISGGDIKEVQSSPGYLTNPTLDRLERAQRVTAGIPAEFGGESGSNIRTGRRGDAVLSAVIDYPVAEAQEAFAFALEEENRVAIALAKSIDGDTPRTLYVGTGNARRPVTYTATKTFEVEQHVVAYPAAGSDMNSLIIGLGQRVGLGTMSKETAAYLDPFIDNPETEHDKIITEGLEQALMSGIQQQAAQGAIPPLTLAKIMMLVSTDKMELALALNKVTEDAAKEAQAAQEEAAQGQQPTVPQMQAPADMAAMMGPNAGAPTSPIPGPNAGQDALAGLLTKLRQPAMTIQPMRGATRGAV